MQIRYTTDAYINGYGMFQDVWAPVTETIISIIVAVIGGYIWGLEGVLLGTIVSMSLIVGIWKPYFLFREGFKTSVGVYWKNFIIYTLCFLSAFLIASFLVNLVRLDPSESFFKWTIYAVIIVSIFSVVYFSILYCFTSGSRDIFLRFKTMFKNKFLSKNGN